MDNQKIDLEVLQSRKLRKEYGIRFTPYKRDYPKVQRNEKCPCGSGLKYKKCCIE